MVANNIPDTDGNTITKLDDIFFYHDPTAFFTIDNRIPLEIRKPLSESINSLKSNFLTGASGGLRKAIYKLFRHENIPEMNQEQNTSLTHDTRVDLLKEKHPKIDPEMIGKTLTVQHYGIFMK